MIGDLASNAIRRAEQELRGLIADAAAAGDYGLVSRLSVIARRVAELADEAAGIPDAAALKLVPASSTAEMPGGNLEAKETRRRIQKGTYPRFEKTRDMLVKIGWSKKEHSEYVHKAPKAGLDAVARRVMDLGRGGRMFTTEELLPVNLGGGDGELPGYQAYLSLAWLRDIGVVEQHGREGYSVQGDDLIGAVGKNWESLPAMRR
jgi:hypothetical protein